MLLRLSGAYLIIQMVFIYKLILYLLFTSHGNIAFMFSCGNLKLSYLIFWIDFTQVPIVVGVVVLLCVLLLITCIAVKRLKEPFTIWMHDRHGIRFCDENSAKTRRKLERSESGSILFEALVVYSYKDEAHVNDLVKQLEPPYRLCLNHRDLSGIYTSEAFKSAVKASICHLVIFLKLKT